MCIRDRLGKVRVARGQAESGRKEIAAALPGLTNGLGPGHATTQEAQDLLRQLVAHQ